MVSFRKIGGRKYCGIPYTLYNVHIIRSRIYSNVIFLQECVVGPIDALSMVCILYVIFQ